MADPTLTQLDDRELENQTVDTANFPYQKQRAMLYWTGTAWAKWDGGIKGTSSQVNAHPVTSGGTSLVDTQGGQTYQKVGIVADMDKFVEGVQDQNTTISGFPVLIGGRTDVTDLTTKGVVAIPGVLGSDADARPTTSSGNMLTRAYLYGYNGTNWDRLRTDTTNGLDVDVTRLPALVAGSAIIGKVTTDQTTHGTTDLVAADITKVGGNSVNAETTGELVTRSQVKLSGILRTTQSVTATTSTAATNFGATASKRNYIVGYSIWNSSAVDTFVRLQDGNGGSDFWIIPAPKGGGANVYFETPIPQPTTNTALYFAEGAAASTIYVSLLGFQAA